MHKNEKYDNLRNVRGPNPEKVGARRAFAERWGPEFWGPEGWWPQGWGPEGWGPRPWKVRAPTVGAPRVGPEGWGPKGGGSKAVGPKISRFFLPPPTPPSITPPKFHETTPKRGEILGLPPFGPHPSRPLHRTPLRRTAQNFPLFFSEF